MSVSIFGQTVRHALKTHWPDPDPRLAWTRCGIRFCYDPTGYQRAMHVTGNPKPTGQCEVCFA